MPARMPRASASWVSGPWRASPPESSPREEGSAHGARVGADPLQNRVVEQAVRGDGVAAPRAVLAGEGGEPPARLGDDGHEGSHVVDRELGLRGDVDGALGDE